MCGPQCRVVGQASHARQPRDGPGLLPGTVWGIGTAGPVPLRYLRHHLINELGTWIDLRYIMGLVYLMSRRFTAAVHDEQGNPDDHRVPWTSIVIMGETAPEPSERALHRTRWTRAEHSRLARQYAQHLGKVFRMHGPTGETEKEKEEKKDQGRPHQQVEGMYLPCLRALRTYLPYLPM